MRSPVIITVSCLHPNRAKWVQEKHLSSLVQAHLGSALCLSFGTSCVSLALNARCWFSLLMPCALLRYWFFPPRSWNSAPDFEMLQGSISWFFFLLDDLICRNVLNFLRSLFFSGVSSGNITADCHASVFVLLSLENYYCKYIIFIYCNIMKYEEMNKNKNWYFLCSLCLRNLFCITEPKLKHWDGRGNQATTSIRHVSVHRKKKQTGFHFQECERCQWRILQ